MRMNRTDWKYLIDTLLFISGFGAAILGFLMGVVLPGGSAAPEAQKYFLGLHRHQWGGFHFALAIIFIALLLIHLVLEWSWIRGKARQLFGHRWWGFLVLTVVAVCATLLIFWLLTGKRVLPLTGAAEAVGDVKPLNFNWNPAFRPRPEVSYL